MHDINSVLTEKFGFHSFKQGQKETIESLLDGRDTFTILPTGTGKSLCYQLPSYLFNGHTLIVSPLISLMEDQVTQLRQQGEKSVVAINSLLDQESKYYLLHRLEQYKYIFMSPETLSRPTVMAKIKSLPISLLVVDEAHCISQWGHDFRPSYLQLRQVKEELGFPLTLALTATATEAVREDIEEQLFVTKPVNKIIYPINRPNIFYKVEACEEKMAYLTEFLTEHMNVPGIIYFSSKKEAERITLLLSEQLSIPVAYYHGDMSTQDRVKIQQQFLQDDIRVLCATSAFGMGVNKENIRFVIHYHLPESLESYVQESGRAGRDGKQSVSIILYQEGDERIHYFLQDESFNQKKDLLFLKNKSKNQVKQLVPSLNDLQLKWMDQLEKADWDWETFERNLALKKSQQLGRLTKIKEYVLSQNCRREDISNYFNDNIIKEKPDKCCDHCDSEIPELSSILTLKQSELHMLDSKNILKKLFLT